MTKQKESPSMTIDVAGMKKVGKGALIAGSAVALTYILENIGTVDFGTYTALIVGIASVLINFLRKFLMKYK